MGGLCCCARRDKLAVKVSWMRYKKEVEMADQTGMAGVRQADQIGGINELGRKKQRMGKVEQED